MSISAVEGLLDEDPFLIDHEMEEFFEDKFLAHIYICRLQHTAFDIMGEEGGRGRRRGRRVGGGDDLV